MARARHQLNPNFESAESVEELVAEDLLDPGCGRIFRVSKGDGSHWIDARLEAQNPEYDPIEISPGSADDFRPMPTY